MERLDRFWIGAVTFLLVLVIAGGAAILARRPAADSALTITPQQIINSDFGQALIEGEVANPGIYPLNEDDVITDLLDDAGGVTVNDDEIYLRIFIHKVSDYSPPQKIDLNRAETWLLEALPGIGPTLAQRIVDYRREHGPFHFVQDLISIQGIGEVMLEQIIEYVTVGD